MHSRQEWVIVNSLEQKQLMTLEFEGSRRGRRCFLGVYPFHADSEVARGSLAARGKLVPPPEFLIFNLRKFEVAAELIDSERHLSEGDLHLLKEDVAYGMPQLRRMLPEFGCELSQLLPPWRTAYPL